MRKGGGHIYDGIDISILTGGVLNDYERGSSCFAGPCSHPHLHRRGTPAGIEEQFVASEVPQTVPMMLPDNDWRGCKLKSASPHLRLLATSTRKSTLSVRTNGIERLPHAVHIKMVAAIGIHVLVEQRRRECEVGSSSTWPSVRSSSTTRPLCNVFQATTALWSTDKQLKVWR